MIGCCSLSSGLVNSFYFNSIYASGMLLVLMSSHLNSGRACPGGLPCRSRCRYPRRSWTRRRRRTSTPPSSAPPISSPPAASAGRAGTATPPEASRKRYGTPFHWSLHCSSPLAVARLPTHINRIHSVPRRLQRLVRRAGSLSA